MKLVLIRHGESEWNKLNLFTGWTDVELSDTGVLEAKKAGKILLSNNFSFDVCFTSFLKRAIHTLNNVLYEMDLEYLPVYKSYKLNERHYGALQGLNKVETAKKYGEEQVKIWRRSFDVKPPKLNEDDERNPRNQKMYKDIGDKNSLPLAESLEDTINRVVPYFETIIKPYMLNDKKVLIVAHGNSLRALVKYIDNLSNSDIINVNISTGVPLVYEFDSNFKVIKKEYLLNEDDLKAKFKNIERQGMVK